MDRLQRFITEIESLNLPCRYTVSWGDDYIWVSAQIESPQGEKLADCSLPAEDCPKDILPELQRLMPTATICRLDNKIYIDNLR